MIVRCNDAGTAIQIMSQSHGNTLDLAEILHRLGRGTYEFQFVFPEETSDRPRIELTKKAPPPPADERVAELEQVGWWNPIAKRLCYLDEKESQPVQKVGYTMPIFTKTALAALTSCLETGNHGDRT